MAARSSPSSTNRPAARLAAEIGRQLQPLANPARAAAEKRYLRSDLDFLRTGVPAVRRIVRAVRRQNAALDRRSVLDLVRTLWNTPLHERRMAALEVLRAYQGGLEPGDLALVERLIRDSRTWAYVDELSADIAGGLVERHPELMRTLDRWARDTDFWVRRSALLAMLRPLRRGGGDFVRFGRCADGMLDETEFFIRKAIGWVLREVGRQRPDLVYEWLAPRAQRASGVTMREAVKYLPAGQRAALLRARAASGRGLR